MKSRKLRFVIVSLIWMAIFVFAAEAVAATLSSQTRNYVLKDGTQAHLVIPAEPKIVWDRISTPVFAIPAVVFFFLGWILVWRLFRDFNPRFSL